jgi:hypothetical protein
VAKVLEHLLGDVTGNIHDGLIAGTALGKIGNQRVPVVTILQTDAAWPAFGLQDCVVSALAGSHTHCGIEWADEDLPVTDLGSLIHFNYRFHNRVHIGILNHNGQESLGNVLHPTRFVSGEKFWRTVHVDLACDPTLYSTANYRGGSHTRKAKLFECISRWPHFFGTNDGNDFLHVSLLEPFHACSDGVCSFDRTDEYFAVTEVSRVRSVLDNVDDIVNAFFFDNHEDHCLGKFFVANRPDSDALLLASTEDMNLRHGDKPGVCKRFCNTFGCFWA